MPWLAERMCARLNSRYVEQTSSISYRAPKGIAASELGIPFSLETNYKTKDAGDEAYPHHHKRDNPHYKRLFRKFDDCVLEQDDRFTALQILIQKEINNEPAMEDFFNKFFNEHIDSILYNLALEAGESDFQKFKEVEDSLLEFGIKLLFRRPYLYRGDESALKKYISQFVRWKKKVFLQNIVDNEGDSDSTRMSIRMAGISDLSYVAPNFKNIKSNVKLNESGDAIVYENANGDAIDAIEEAKKWQNAKKNN